MLLKGRTESVELISYRLLNKRMELTEKEKFHYLNLVRGYEGEVKFDALLADLAEERYIINDLLLEVNHSHFQIDTLIIAQGVIHLLDTKNYQGDYYLESDRFYSKTNGREYKNPVDQLKRSATLLRQLLQMLKQDHLVDASVLFINPEFTLYQAPKDYPIILPTQINRFLKDLNKTPSKLNEGHKKLAQTLISLYQNENPFSTSPTFTYEQLRKGLTCANCCSFYISVDGRMCICRDCGHHELVSSAVIRSVNEFKILLPNEKITTNIIHDWCKVVDSKQRIRAVLRKHYKIVGVHQWTYYE